MRSLVLMMALVALSPFPALSEVAFTQVETQYIAALGDPKAVSGAGD